MPYILSKERPQFDKVIKEMPLIRSVGQLNYIVSRLCLLYLGTDGRTNYQGFNDVIGILSCIQQEIYRRKIADYENEKIFLNGDIE